MGARILDRVPTAQVRPFASPRPSKAPPLVPGASYVGPLSLFVITPGDGALFRLEVAGGDTRVAMALAESPIRLSQLGRTIDLAVGEWTLFRADRPASVAGGARLRVARLPAQVFPELGASPLNTLLRRFPQSEPINRIVFSLFSAIFDEAGGLAPGDGEDLAQAALHVAKKAVAGCGTAAAKTILVDRVHEFIEWRIRDPRLSPDHIAKAFNCTARNIHRAFEGEPESLGQYILRRRLERCREELLGTPAGARSVTEIAFSWGFNNAAHFSRVFRNHFGCSPTGCRAGARLPDRNGPIAAPL